MPYKGVVFNILRYCIHDGPGIRTTIFFKGCPLSCKWCHNPESLDPLPLPLFHEEKCIKCGRCNNAAEPFHDSCPTGARETIGRQYTAPELIAEIKKDLPFYEQSGGGVSFSGGEPMSQAEFILELLFMCREEYINTAIDTSGHCNTGAILKAAELTDYILYDVKFADGKKHEKFCGASNGLILENLFCLASTGVKLLLRIPVIPGINDDMEEMTAIFELVKDFKNIESVHLLPYHNIYKGKYKKAGKQEVFCRENGLEISANESINIAEIKKLFGARFIVKIGG